MKKLCLLLALAIIGTALYAQDEGTISKRERIARDKSIFFGIGPSFTLGKNIGDYSTGLNFEFGFTKRLNRVLSIGPSLSYLEFSYDPDKTGANNAFISEAYLYGDDFFDYFGAAYIDFKGGDLTLVSAALNLKLNFVPVKDDSKISIYGFVKPFVSSVTRSEVTGTAYIFPVPDLDASGFPSEDEVITGATEFQITQVPWEAGAPEWQEFGVTISDELKEDSRVTGGIFIGPGIELFPAKKFSIYAQAAFGYTFPVSFVSTKKYEGNRLEDLNERFPIVEEGFPSVSLQFGASFNF